MELSGSALTRRLEAMRERYRLNPSESSGTASAEIAAPRIMCSDGLVLV